MYKTILLTLEGTPTDRAIIEHIKPLAKLMGSRVVLFHVAAGAPARVHGEEAAGEEVEKGPACLRQVREELNQAGIRADAVLACGEPAKEIVKWIERQGCDLVAMSTHGHQFVADLVLGTTAFKVQHSISVPMLMLRAK
jgi:nucleotide-binding universal stress UspA family protein